MIYIGIDPGQNGGIGVLGCPDNSEMRKPYAYRYDDEQLIWQINKWLMCSDVSIKNIKVFLENVQGFPGRSAKTAVAQGKSWGIIVGILKVFNIEPVIVKPNTWKKEFDLLNSKLSYKEKKQLDIAKAKELFPNVNLVPPGCKVPHDGMADALLIAEWGRRQDEKNSV